MSYDALVWLLVGLGVGVAGSLMLLMGYAALERGRLGRRLRQARAVTQVAEVAPVRAVTPPPAAALVARPKPAETKPAEAKPAEAKPPEPKPAPARPVLVATVAATPERVGPPAPVTPVAPAPIVAAPVSAAVPAISGPVAPKRPQSVEAMFAEAFANDKLSVSPEPEEAAKPPKA